MKLIKPSIEIWEQTDFTLEGIKKHIERCARVCYKSEDKITDDSYEKFVQMLIDRGHTAMLEHGTAYLTERYSRRFGDISDFNDIKSKWEYNSYSKVNTTISEDNLEMWKFVTTNYRVLLENKCLIEPVFNAKHHLHGNINHYKRITVKLICSRAVAQQLTRHRKFSFAMESQRYCNYSNDKFDNEITFMIPQWYENTKYYDYHLLKEFEEALTSIEKLYMFYISKGLTPQQARAVLPNCTKTELVMTGFVEDWEYLFKLRCSDSLLGKPDPETSYLADKIREEFKSRNLIS